MKVWKKAAIGLGFLVVVGVLAVGYLGFLPGVSDAMGTNKPVDLGVKPTPADLDSARRKLAELQSPSDQPVRIQLTSSEITKFVEREIGEMIDALYRRGAKAKTIAAQHGVSDAFVSLL